MLTKVGDPSCLKTEVGGKQGHALHKKQSIKNYLVKDFVKKWPPVPGSSSLFISKTSESLFFAKCAT